MYITVSSLNILFEDPFWIGIYERESNGHYEVCKITFGAEPKDYEVYDFMLKNWNRLRFSPSIKVAMIAEKRMNSKRVQRLVNKQIKNVGIGTKAQQALKLQQEQGKSEQKSLSRKQHEEEIQLQFEMRQKKRKKSIEGIDTFYTFHIAILIIIYKTGSVLILQKPPFLICFLH